MYRQPRLALMSRTQKAEDVCAEILSFFSSDIWFGLRCSLAPSFWKGKSRVVGRNEGQQSDLSLIVALLAAKALWKLNSCMYCVIAVDP